MAEEEVFAMPTFSEENHSLLKKCLSEEIFDELKDRKSASGFTLKQAIQSGLDHQDSGIGVYAGDTDSYTTFAPLFDAIIQEYHGHSPDDKHISNFDADELKAPEANDDFVVSTRIRVGRNLEAFPLGPAVTKEQRDEIETQVSDALKTLEGDLKGTYYPIKGMSDEDAKQLTEDHFLFKSGDRFLQSAGLNRDWPDGRGIFHNDAKTFLVWVNEEDQLRIISMQKGGNIKEVFARLSKAVEEIDAKCKFSFNEHLGYITSCPTNLGTAMRASVHIKLPLLSKDMDAFKAITDKHHLQIRGIHGEHSEDDSGIYDVSNKRRLGFTEVDLVQGMYDGVQELVTAEKALQSKQASSSGTSESKSEETRKSVDTENGHVSLKEGGDPKRFKPKPTSPAEVAELISKLKQNVEKWNKTGAKKRVALLQACIANLKRETRNWVRASALGHGYDPNNPKHYHGIADCVQKGPAMIGSWFNQLLRSYVSLRDHDCMPKNACLAKKTRQDGTTHIQVAPAGLKQKKAAAGASCHLVIGKGVKIKQISPLTKPSGVTAILCPGNFDGPSDILDTLFMKNCVVVYKPNPVNEATSPVIARVLKPLIDYGVCVPVNGGGEVGAAMVNDPNVDSLLMTGGAKTYDRIVWGPDPEAAKKTGKRAVTKPFGAELGSVNPYIITPGKWSKSALNAHAQQLAAAKLVNDGHICACPQIVITCKQWPQREKFLERVRYYMIHHPGTNPYYPGCDRSYAAQLEHFKEEMKCEDKDIVFQNPKVFDGQLAPLFATGISEDSWSLQNEAFCPVLAEVALDTAPAAKEFLPKAVKFANEKLWGSLSAALIVDNKTMKSDPDFIEQMIDEMNFGAIGVNSIAMNALLWPQITWGAFPGHSPKDIQSGMGYLGNVFGFEGVVKSIVRAPHTWEGQGITSKIPTNGKKWLKVCNRYMDLCVYDNLWRLTKLGTAVKAGI